MISQDSFIPCRLCKSKKTLQNKPGYYYVDSEYLGIKTTQIVECSCHKDFVKKQIFKINCKESGVWDKSLDYDPSKDYVGDLSKVSVTRFSSFINNFEKFKDVLVYMQGPNGTQKTTLAQWAGASLIWKNYSVKYMLMQNLLMLLMSGFESDLDKIENIKRLHKYDLLIVDEAFSKDKVTLYESGYQLPFFDRFLRERLEINKKSILFISNKLPDEIEKNKFSYSIQDFVIRNLAKGNTLLTFNDNYLKNKNTVNLNSIFD